MKIYKVTPLQRVKLQDVKLSKKFNKLGFYMIGPWYSDRGAYAISINKDDVDFGDKWLNRFSEKYIDIIEYEAVTNGSPDFISEVTNNYEYTIYTSYIHNDLFNFPSFELFLWHRSYEVSITLDGFPENFCREFAKKYGNYYSHQSVSYRYDLRKTLDVNIELLMKTVGLVITADKDEFFKRRAEWNS